MVHCLVASSRRDRQFFTWLTVVDLRQEIEQDIERRSAWRQYRSFVVCHCQQRISGLTLINSGSTAVYAQLISRALERMRVVSSTALSTVESTTDLQRRSSSTQQLLSDNIWSYSFTAYRLLLFWWRREAGHTRLNRRNRVRRPNQRERVNIGLNKKC